MEVINMKSKKWRCTLCGWIWKEDICYPNGCPCCNADKDEITTHKNLDSIIGKYNG